MNTPDSLKSENQNSLNFIIKNWEKLDEPQKSILTKVWKVITYKWKLQILFNLPFLIWWFMDKSITEVHTFDMTILNYLNLPEWVLSFIGFGK